MKTQATFVGTERAVHLHAKAAVHLDLSLVVDPWNTELNHSLRFHQTLKDSGVAELLASFNDRPDRLQHLSYGLKKLRLVRITFFNDFENVLNQSHRIYVILVIGEIGRASCRERV